MAETATTPAPTPTTPTATPSKTITATILCVDDELNILSSMKRLFRPFGYRIITADSGAKGLEIIEQEKGKINVIISDMRMPNMNGAEFLSQVRQKYPDIMRILLTGYSDMDSTVDAINDGQIYRYVSKPWNEADLISCIKEALKVQHLKAEKERLEKLTREQNNQLKILNASLEDKVAKRTADLRTANEKLKKNFLTSIKIFSSLIELRGGKVAGHSRRTAELSRKIAVEMKLPVKDINDIFLAGLLHDIGKIGFSDELLNKAPVKMTPEERKIFCEHPTKGEELLMPLEDMRGAATIIRSHHEHFDGNGYPKKLAGEQIPIGARILAVANEHDGLVEGYLTGTRQIGVRVYDYIRSHAGTRYDPKVVEIYEKLLWPGANAHKVTTAQVVTNSNQNPNSVNANINAVDKKAAPSKVSAAADQYFQDIDEEVEMLVPIFALRSGMVLSRDLFNANGTMLLAADFVLNAYFIEKLKECLVQRKIIFPKVCILKPEEDENDIKPLEQDLDSKITTTTANSTLQASSAAANTTPKNVEKNTSTGSAVLRLMAQHNRDIANNAFGIRENKVIKDLSDDDALKDI